MKKRKRRKSRIWQAVPVFALLLVLCGCTRKDELLLLDREGVTETVEDASAVLQDSSGQTASAEGAVGASAGESREAEVSAVTGTGQTEEAAAQSGVIYVHVCGAVMHSGVYELAAGSRVYEAVQQAGGFAENAEQNYVNQAQTLEDGVKLVIPTREEAAAAESEAAPTAETAQGGISENIGIVRDDTAEGLGIVGGASQDGQKGDEAVTAEGRININTASEAELCKIAGVGATRAVAIAAYRETHGAFEKPEDIMKVSGIKEGMYEKIKDSICVN